MANNIHVVPHFHWDREWYFTTEESKILLVNDMEEVMEMLESDDDYPCYVLDGQTAVLEDYLSVKPESRERLKKLIDDGRLIIGPWYTQTDEMVVGGESIVRNLLYGKKDCDEFGPRMMIGYLPDSFGQSARLPQILNGFGIDRCIFWRGTSERMGTTKTDFIWKGDDNSSVTVLLMPLGYAIGKYLPTDEEELKNRLDKYFPVLDRGAVTDNILLPNGHDQMPIQKNIKEVMALIEKLYPGRKTRLGRYEDVFEEIEKAELDTLKGEFLDGKYMRVHRSIYSSRADLKAANTRIENKITNILEPLASIAYSLGFPYHHGLIEAIWKELMKNHAHDSIGCCCSDKVHRAICDRFFLAEDRTDNLIEFYKRKITDAMSCDITLDKLTVFNTLPYERTSVIKAEIITKMKGFVLTDENGGETDFEVLKTEIVDAGLIDRQIVHYGDYDPFIRYTVAIYDTVLSMGYKTYLIKESTPISVTEPNYAELENEYIKAEIAKNGTLTVTDKATGEKYENVLLVEDGSDDGDGYDYSPLENDYIVTSENVKADVIVNGTENIKTAKISFEMAVPKNLDSRKNKVCDGSIDISFNIELRKGSKLLDITMDVNNQADDHRIRVLVPGNGKAEYSISDNQFGVIKRKVYDDAMDVWEEEKWSERPDSIYPFLSYVKSDSKKSLAVLTNSVREYELVGDDYGTIAITVSRSVGVLGKEKLYRRPGRPSGIKLETPDSQMIGKNSYSFAIAVNSDETAKLAKEYTTPVVSYNKMPYNAMKLNASGISVPYTKSILNVDGGAVLSVLKKAEDKEGLVIRMYNSDEKDIDIVINTPYNVSCELMLDEEKTDRVIENNTIAIAPNGIKTVLLEKK